MQPKSDVEIERAKMVKVFRAMVRLKHSAAADEEIARKLPALVARFDGALTRGEAFELTAADVLAEVE